MKMKPLNLKIVQETQEVRRIHVASGIKFRPAVFQNRKQKLPVKQGARLKDER